MVYAYVMIETGAGKSGELLTRIGDVPAVLEAHVVAGEFDVIAEVEADAVYDVLDSVSSTIGAFAGVEETRTYVALE
jgi:DNA-binding Lrp family transcriptional regulator